MKKKIAAVMGSFHKEEVERMVAEASLAAGECKLEIAEKIWVPGSMEKPLALKRQLIRPEIQGAVALGIIERGETKHGMVMGQTVIAALIQLQLELMKPIGIGILGPEILPDQIEPRLLPYARKAVEAVAAML